jgi:hypothetical protein
MAYFAPTTNASKPLFGGSHEPRRTFRSAMAAAMRRQVSGLAFTSRCSACIEARSWPAAMPSITRL